MGKTPGAVAATLKTRTGKSVQDWARIVQRSGLRSRRERVSCLMAEHALGRIHGKPADYSGPEALLAGIFAGSKAAAGLGSEVEVLPCRTQVTIGRNRQFAWIKPATNTRLDLGLAPPGVKLGGRPDRPGAIDAELKRWLKTAYEPDAG